jgi:hypothetical protein
MNGAQEAGFAFFLDSQQGFLLGNPSEIKNFRPKPCFGKNTQKKFSVLSHVSKKHAKKVLHSDVFLKIKAEKSFRKNQKNFRKAKKVFQQGQKSFSQASVLKI